MTILVSSLTKGMYLPIPKSDRFTEPSALKPMMSGRALDPNNVSATRLDVKIPV